MLVVSFLLMMSTMGCVSDDGGNAPPKYPYIGVTDVRIDEDRYVGWWDFSFEVKRADYAGEKFLWTEFSIMLTSFNRAVTMEKVDSLKPWNGSNRNTVEGWYVKHGPDATRLEVGDVIMLTGDRDYDEGTHYANLELWQNNYTVMRASSTIGQMVFNLDFVSIAPNANSSGTKWDLRINVDDREPFDKTASIGQLDMRVETGDHVLTKPDLDLTKFQGEYPTTLSALYIVTHDDSLVHSGDVIVVTGLDARYQDGCVYMMFDSHPLGSVELPAQF